MWPPEKKYDPLYQHLLLSGRGQKAMTFADIETILGKPLPLSARKRPEWWSNSARGHSQAEAWRKAGYKTSKIDLVNETVEFKLEDWPEGYTKAAWPFRNDRRAGAGLGEGDQAKYGAPPTSHEHPLFGIWEGKVTLLPGVDYSAPVFDADDAA
jgi:hypothetical protein